MSYEVTWVIKKGVGVPYSEASWSWLRNGLAQLEVGDCLEAAAPEGLDHRRWATRLCASAKGYSLQETKAGRPVKYSTRCLDKEVGRYGIFRVS